MREIVVDTETTGLDPQTGHRIVEIACLELLHHVPTGRKFHRYVNPERDMPADALAVHGLTEEFLARHPLFPEIVDELLKFIGEDRLVIHNAEFDLAFLNAELRRVGRPLLACPFVDTLAVARSRFPGNPASLDALCRRFAIDLSGRELHGAALDCRLLADVYIELLGGRQPGLDFLAGGRNAAISIAPEAREVRPPRPHAPLPAELAAHQEMLALLKDPLWLIAAAAEANQAVVGLAAASC
jgi:DNA polymerase-3 subunit epsilon